MAVREKERQTHRHTVRQTEAERQTGTQTDKQKQGGRDGGVAVWISIPNPLHVQYYIHQKLFLRFINLISDGLLCSRQRQETTVTAVCYLVLYNLINAMTQAQFQS